MQAMILEALKELIQIIRPLTALILLSRDSRENGFLSVDLYPKPTLRRVIGALLTHLSLAFPFVGHRQTV